jgi:hypothetical protein
VDKLSGAPGVRVGEQLLPGVCVVPGRCRTATRGGRQVTTPVAATYALLTDGGTVAVRPARPQDFEAVRAMQFGSRRAAAGRPPGRAADGHRRAR